MLDRVVMCFDTCELTSVVSDCTKALSHLCVRSCIALLLENLSILVLINNFNTKLYMVFLVNVL